ncbi:hypothetical protein BS17DRAFT_881030 [Gyrodon lividus]|nr:hypothetical protein BS17DRAFT_881030 [Gyrodon lividus]
MSDSTAHRIDLSSLKKVHNHWGFEVAPNFELSKSHITATTRTGESEPSNTAVLNTLRALYQFNNDLHEAVPDVTSSHPTFIPSVTTLVAAGASPPDEEHRAFMNQLTSGAQTAASSNFQSSIVAGLLSDESNEEFTDIGLWLGSGDFQAGQEMAVVTSLGLREWIQHDGAKVGLTSGRAVSFYIPVSQITTRGFQAPRSTEDTAAFLTAYRGLKGSHCFCVSPGGGPAIACFMLGEIHQRWCGLVSIAATSDSDY